MAKKKQHLHEKRGVSFQEIGALLGARELLRAKTAEFVPNEKWYDRGRVTEDLLYDGAHLFNMNVACYTSGCGSVGCIGGTMAQIMGKIDLDSYVLNQREDHNPFKELFFPAGQVPEDEHGHWVVTAEQAVQAIDNWIKYGKPRWKQITGGPKKKSRR